MPSPGELVQSADYAFAFRRLEPLPNPPHSLLVLLHGVGGDEDQLAALGARAPDGMLVVLPRGHRSISGDKWGWYRVGFGEDGPQPVEEEMHEARERLAGFLSQLQGHHDVPPARTWVGGFSQGGILAASVALTEPSRVTGFAMVSGRLPPEIDASIAPRDALQHLRALVVHGRDDNTLPVDGAIDAAGRLERLGLHTELRLHDGGHALRDAMADDVARWLGDAAAR